ncbi:MAG: TRZ/ATZ family hydrolase [Gammaproteobacteria bacterium]|nr:TRZ/ATZ family hydrolase [Gammaproteobacteria bacterium]MDH5511743.1 TRZ/ATZ family hydrolase [Gammaproteobacteria bacterium]
MQTIDALINARWVIPVEPDGQTLDHHSVAVHGGKIVELLPTKDAARKYRATETVDLPHHAVIPGLVNAHTHAAMSLFRGLADDLPLMDWLNNHIWPAEAKWVNPDFVRDGTELAVAEMLKSGTTCFSDMYFFPDVTARACVDAGMRAVVGLIMLDFPSAWAQDAEEYLHKGLKLHDALRNSELITTAFAPHAPYTVSDAPLEKIRMYADELDIPVHMHVHETAHEVSEAQKQHGLRPLARLAKLGLLGPRLIAVHMTQLEAGEIRMLAQDNVSVVHCPESNLKLASGFCPVDALVKAGVNVALGTDGAASNNSLDMLEEMHIAALLAKGVSGEATAIPARTALRMATLNGAKALGIEARTGSLTAGKAADIAAIDLSAISSQPVYDPVSQIVYATTRNQVSDVWVNGKHLLAQYRLTGMDEDKLRKKAIEWHGKITGK